jgi:CheY-like chemotaxis protein
MHGGSIEARSDGPGRGSEFTIRMPVVLDAAAEIPGAGHSRLARVQARVIVIDDNADAAETLALLVEHLGAEVITAGDGESGLRRALDFEPDVVLLDLGLPDLDGYGVCRRLRSHPAGRHAFIVAVTGWGQEHDKRRALEAGFDAHVTKPLDRAQLETLLARMRPEAS